MIRTRVQISGMRCGMCEAHINEAVRSAFPVKKVTSSRRKGETVILSEAPVDTEVLRQAIQASGYIMLSAVRETVDRPSLLSRLLKRNP